MSYIGNAKTPLIYATNVRDDIIPNGIDDTFTLSQEVPGGYENNVVVVRRKYLQDVLVAGNTSISIDGTAEKIVVTNPDLAAALSIVQPPIPNVYPGDNLVISGASNGTNNNTFPVLSVLYDGNTIEIFLDGNLITETGTSLTLTRAYVGSWEILEAETDYAISGSLGPTYNKQITFTDIPQPNDVLYVLHRGDATYNFVPSPFSVGPDQLQQNLRNFNCDRFTGDGSTTNYVLSQVAVSSKSLQVSVDGILLDGDDPDQSFTGDWELLPDGDEIQFHSAPANLSKIRILHLGFSTISRRAALSPGQVAAIPPNSITATQLAPNSVTSSELDNGSVTKPKLAADAADGTKILLSNNEYLRAKDSLSTAQGLLKLDGSNNLGLNSPLGGLINFKISDSDNLILSSTQLRPAITNTISLGTSGLRWSSLFVQGAATLGSIASGAINSTSTVIASGNITSSAGDVSGVNGIFTNINITTINSQPLSSIGNNPGDIKMTGKSSPDSGWLLCDGAVYAQIAQPNLYAAIGNSFNIGGEGVGNFRVPDLRQRFPLGKAASGTGSVLGSYGGTIDHTHIGAAHTHDLSNHFHNIPPHYHGMGPGATLNITSSGSHTTSLDHTHPVFSTSAGTPHTHANTLSVDAVGDHFHDITHNHGVDRVVLQYDNTGFATQNFLDRIPNAPHGGAPYVTTNIANMNTTNSGTAGGHGHTLSGGISNESSHTHSVAIPALGAVASPSDGSHIHSSSSFSGLIGNVGSGNDGNNTILSGSPSNNNTGSGGALATSSNNPPFCVVNFIIKT